MRLLQDLTTDPSRMRPLLAMAVAAAAAFMVMVSIGARAVDFAYVLTAGRMWIAGADPYGSGFAAAGAGILPAGATGFAYPPNWWTIAVALAAFPPDSSVMAWKLLNVAALVAAGLLLVRSAKRLPSPPPDWLSFVFLACLFTSGATLNALRLGQTSIAMLLGFALLIDGITADRRWPQVAGLALLLLKPQIGLLFWLLAAARKQTRGAAFGASAVTIAACLPVLFTLGVAGTIASAANFVRNLGAYDELPWNWPGYMSGLPFYFSGVGIRLSPLIALVAAWVVAETALRRARSGSAFAGSFWLVSTNALAAIVPLHLYDFVLCIPGLLLVPSLRSRVSGGLLLLCAALVWSANELARGLFLLRGGSDEAYWAATRFEAGVLTLAGLCALAAALRPLFAKDSTKQDWSGGSADYRPA